MFPGFDCLLAVDLRSQDGAVNWAECRNCIASIWLGIPILYLESLMASPWRNVDSEIVIPKPIAVLIKMQVRQFSFENSEVLGLLQ